MPLTVNVTVLSSELGLHLHKPDDYTLCIELLVRHHHSMIDTTSLDILDKFQSISVFVSSFVFVYITRVSFILF